MKYDRYCDIQKLCNLEANKFMILEKVEPHNYNSNSFYDFFTNKRNIKSIPFNFSSPGLVGFLLKDKEGTSITYNTKNNRNTIIGGKTHELGHVTLHLNNNSPSQSFHDDMETIYGDQQDTIEEEANTCGIVYRIPDVTLLSCVDTNNIDYKMILNQLDLPDYVLERRLVRYLQINCLFSYEESYAIVSDYKNKFRYTNHSQLREIFTMDVFERKILQNYIDLVNYYNQERTYVRKRG